MTIVNPYAVVSSIPNRKTSLKDLQEDIKRNVKLRDESLVMQMARGAVEGLGPDSAGRNLSKLFDDEGTSDGNKIKVGKLLIELYRLHDDTNASTSVADLNIEELRASLLESAIEFMKNPEFLQAVITQLVREEPVTKREILKYLDEDVINVN